jgi:hypothetical protein
MMQSSLHVIVNSINSNDEISDCILQRNKQFMLTAHWTITVDTALDMCVYNKWTTHGQMS